jgi:Xaa-Pro aminopeptidase
MSTRRWRIATALVLALSLAPLVSASEFADDLKARRARVMERLGPDAILLLWSAPPRRYSHDIDYEYRQDSDFYYLTGLTQSDSMLVLLPGNASRKAFLFIPDRDPVREHWRGRLLSRDEAAAHTGVETVLSNTQFETFAAAMLSQRPYSAPASSPGADGGGRAVDLEGPEVAHWFGALSAGRARLNLLLGGGRGAEDPTNPALEFARRARDRFAGFQIADATPILTTLRMVKTPYERKVLVRSLEISSEAQIAGMRAARPGAFEYEVKAAIEGTYRGRGAISWSYPSIVGSGPNATILHYPADDRQMQTGDLLLVDAAANYQYMSGDITRTYPVGGTFTQAQKDLYRIVLQAQEDAMLVARRGASIADVHAKAVEVVKAGLLKLGLITDTSGNQYRLWFTHGACHYIGIDVHDVGDRKRPLEPGMAFVIEPGLYIRQSALDSLPRTPENTALIEKILPAVKKYADLGVRVEDSFLMEEAGLRRLSSSVPRTIDEIEQLLRARPATAPAAR